MTKNKFTSDESRLLLAALMQAQQQGDDATLRKLTHLLKEPVKLRELVSLSNPNKVKSSPFNKSLSNYRVKVNYFAVCMRDDTGHCLPSGNEEEGGDGRSAGFGEETANSPVSPPQGEDKPPEMSSSEPTPPCCFLAPEEEITPGMAGTKTIDPSKPEQPKGEVPSQKPSNEFKQRAEPVRQQDSDLTTQEAAVASSKPVVPKVEETKAPTVKEKPKEPKKLGLSPREEYNHPTEYYQFDHVANIDEIRGKLNNRQSLNSREATFLIGRDNWRHLTDEEKIRAVELSGDNNPQAAQTYIQLLNEYPNLVDKPDYGAQVVILQLPGGEFDLLPFT